MKYHRILRPKKSTNVRLLLVRKFSGVIVALSPKFAARLLERVFLWARRRRTPTREWKWLQGARPLRVASGRHRLAAWSWGQGPTILLVHGWEGRGSQMGAFVGPLTAAGFRVVTFDAPGHGRSTGRGSSLVEMADAVADIGRRVGPLYGVIAHSAGAAVTTMALADGLHADQVVFISPPANPGSFLYTLANFLHLPADIPRQVQASLEERFDVRWRDIRPTTLAPHMRMPLLAVHDRDDRQVPLADAREIVGLWPEARLLTTTGLGHVRPLREPGVVTTVVQHFLNARALDSVPGTLTA